MEITRTVKPHAHTEDLRVWYCDGCRVVHMSLDKTMVNFTRQQFSRFAENINDLSYTAWQDGDNSVIDLTSLSPRYLEQ